MNNMSISFVEDQIQSAAPIQLSRATEAAVTMRSLRRVDRFDKRPHKVLISVCDELLGLRNKIERERTVATTALANKDFINILTAIHKRICDSLDDVQTLQESELRRKSMNGTEGTKELIQQVEESEETTLRAVMQPVRENPVVVLRPSEGWLWWRRSNKKKSLPVIKKLKQLWKLR